VASRSSSEVALGLLAALAADAPEITAAATALARGQASVGAGVVTGSNVFNLAALLGLSALVAGGVRFHRRVILLGGIPGSWIAMVCLLTVARVLPPAAGLAVAALALAPTQGCSRRAAPMPDGCRCRARGGLARRRARGRSRAGRSDPARSGNLARRAGRGAAVLSTALNSNAINVTAGLLSLPLWPASALPTGRACWSPLGTRG
jgi:Sodium/calcium exchanger protein